MICVLVLICLYSTHVILLKIIFLYQFSIAYKNKVIKYTMEFLAKYIKRQLSLQNEIYLVIKKLTIKK